jgi:hypothetical protein
MKLCVVVCDQESVAPVMCHSMFAWLLLVITGAVDRVGRVGGHRVQRPHTMLTARKQRCQAVLHCVRRGGLLVVAAD